MGFYKLFASSLVLENDCFETLEIAEGVRVKAYAVVSSGSVVLTNGGLLAEAIGRFGSRKMDRWFWLI